MKKQLLSILLVIFMLVGIMPINAIATENYGEFIDGEHIISDMIAKNNMYAHPRIIMSNEKFENLKTSIGDDSVTAGLLEKLRNKADEILDLPVSEYEIPDGIRLLETSKEIQRRVAALAMAYNIFEDGKYAQRCYEELVAACNFSDWHPSHFLDTAEMSTAFALGYDWLYNWMNDEQRAFLRGNMIEKGLMQVMEDYEDKPRTRTYRWYQDEEGDNWKLVCNGGMSLAALAIGDEDDAKDIAAKVLDYAYKDAYSFVRRAYSKKDGTYKEGLGYWDYATYYLGLYSSALKSTTGTDYGLAAHDGLRKSVDFIRYMSSNTSKSFSFGDDGDSRDTGWAVLLWLAEYYQSYDIAGPRMEKIPSESFNYLDLLWIDEAKYTGPDEDSPTDWGAVGASNASFRNNWDKSGIVAALHAGINDYMYHGHYDLGSFYIESDGARFFTDLGNEQYELPNRQYSYRIRAEGHNTLVINPSQELDQREGAECLITQFNGGNVAYAVTDLTDAYEPSGAESVVRGLKMIKDKECVVIQDEISLNAPGEIYWFAHTKGQIEVANDGKSAVVTVDSEKMWVEIISDDGNFTVMNAESLQTSPVVPNQTDNSNYRKLAIHLTNTKDTTISVACIPLKQGEVQPSWTPSMKALSEWTPQTPEDVADVVAAPEADDTVFTYNGEEQTYTLAESDYYTITGNKQTNAGIYTVTVALKDKDNTVWNDGTTDDKTYNFVINKATPTSDMFTATPSSELVYDGTEKSIIVTTDKVGMGAFTVSYVSFTDSTQPVDAGTYIIRLHIEEGDNYIAVDTLSFSAFVINKANSVISAAPTPIADLVYDGTSQNLINAGTTTDGEMQYSLDGTNYSPAIPTGTDAKTYTVWYKVVGDENHNDTEPASIEVSIAPKSITVTADNASKTYGEDDPIFTFTATGLEGSDTLTGTLSRETGENAGTYAITQGTLTNENNPNYDITFVEGTFTINGVDISAATAVQNGTLTYDGTAQTPTFTVTLGNATLTADDYDVTVTAQTNAGSYTATIAGKGNCSGTIADVAWEILPANIADTSITYAPLTYNGAEQTPVFTIKLGDYTLNASDYSVTVTAQINAGDYTATIVGNLNFDGNIDVDWSIGKKAADEVTSPTAATITYGQTLSEATLTSSWSWVDGTVIPTVINNGYAAEITVDDSNYDYTSIDGYNADTHKITRTIAVTVEKAAPTITTEPYAAAGLVYDGSAKVLVNEGAVTGGSFVYSLTGNNFTATLPTATEAKEYTVYWRVAGDENHNNSETFNFKVTIAKATPPALTIPTATSITYGEKLSASTLSDSSWAWVDGTIVPNASADYNAYIEVDDSNYDYTGVDGYDDVNHRVVRDITVIINKATLTITANSYTIKVGSALPTYEYTVTGLVGNDTLPFDVSLSCSATDSNAVGIYPITISGVASDALASLYAPIYVNGELTITEKDIQEIEADDVVLTYGETGKKITATAIGDISYEVATGEDIISVAADGTITALKAGTATVTITADGNADYAEATKTISVTVNKKKVAIPTADTTEYTYTGTAQTYGVTSTDDYTVEGGVQTNAGEYPITITLNNENYEWDGTLGTYKFVINKAAVTVTAKSYTIKVGDTLPTYAYDVAGLVNGEALPIDVTISCTADGRTAGAFDIVVSGAATSDNYTFAFVNGKLTVVETSAGGETGGESGGNEGGVGGSESIPAVTTPSTTPSYTGRPSWVTIPSETTTTTTTTTTQPPVDEDIDDDTDDEDIEIDEDTDTTKPGDDGDEPQIKGKDDKTGWDTILDELSDTEEGGKVVVDMNGATEVPEDVFEQIKGQDIDLVIELDNGFTWTINGESVTEPMDIDLGVNEGFEIPVKVINSVTDECEYITLTLSHNGEFGFTAVLTVDMGDENEGLYANLYWYTSGNTEFICADKINNKGKADLTFTHASEYIIVIDETNHGKRVEESDNADEDADSDVDNIFNREEDDDVNPFTAVTISFTGVIISAATIMIARKRKKQ